MKKIAEGDLLRRIRLNRKRLSAKMYRYPDIFNKKYSASWPGDWEGRCILSLTSLYFALSGYDKDQESVLNQLDDIISHLKEHINEDGYFGNIVNDEYLDEQQVSGNSWYLRGLIEYYQISRSDEILSIIKSVVNKFIYKIAKFYEHYPISTREIGGVGGHIEGVIRDGWLTSSDVGCAFIMLDAMSEAYYLLRDDKLKEILIKVIDKFINLDFINLKCQTHATLSCARGILTFYEATKEEKYLNYAIDIFKKYINYGMTLDYSNINWFNRKDTWTEPCCIVDSFILTSKFYQITKDDKYLLLLNRIYLNSFRMAQRNNGGAGCNTCLIDNNDSIKCYLYEAFFCCTMRLGEGLRFVKKYSSFNIDNELLVSILEDMKIYGNNQEEISIKGDIYNKEKVRISFKNIKNNLRFAVYLPETVGFSCSNKGLIREGDKLIINVDKDTNLNIKFTLNTHIENNLYFVGDMLLAKRNLELDEKCFNIDNERYYFLIDYSKLKNKKETLKVSQTL